jgi:hypothetical protein
MRGIHTHVRVYMHGALCGNLVFRNDEFAEVRGRSPHIQFIEDPISGHPSDDQETVESLKAWQREAIRMLFAAGQAHAKLYKEIEALKAAAEAHPLKK